MRKEMSVAGSHAPGCSEAVSQSPLFTRHVFLSAEPRGPRLVIPQLQERPSAFRPAHEAICLTPSRPSSRCGEGPRSSSADRELGRRGAGPSFLLLRASGGFAACMSPGRQGSQDCSTWQGPERFHLETKVTQWKKSPSSGPAAGSLRLERAEW